MKRLLMLLVFVQAGLVFSSSAHSGSERVKRAAHTCGSNETKITMPYITEDNVECTTVIGRRQNLYNMEYRTQCERWLGSPTSSVASAYVENCQKYGSRGAKYLVSVCCHGAVSDLRCFTCNNAANSYECAYQGQVVSCQSGQVCMAEQKNFTLNRRSHGGLFASCAQKEVCQAQYNDRSKDCRSYIRSPNCTQTCCDTAFCDFSVSLSRLYATAHACISSPCYNGGTCVLNSTLSSGYHCVCPTNYVGSRCQSYVGPTSPPRPRVVYPCSRRPCQNGGSCSNRGTTDYRCYCKISFTGKNCSEDAPLCSNKPNYCLGGGTCYDHGSFGVRCLCPPGRVGAKCEFSSLLSCNNPTGYFNSTNHYRSLDSYYSRLNCTGLKAYIEQRWRSSFLSSCIYKMKGEADYFRENVHGSVRRSEITTLQYCKNGEDYIEYKAHQCCPSCYSNPCQNGGWCRQKSTGDYSCQCRFGYEGKDCESKAAMCVIAGDPHFDTLDGQKIHFQGSCMYNWLSPTAANLGIPDFSVLGKHESRNGNDRVTYISFVLVKVGGQTIRLARNGSILVDGETVYPDTQFPGFLITQNGRFNRIQTGFGLIVEYDGFWTALIKVPDSFGSKVSGLCGNFDGDAANDLVTSAGVDVSGSSTKYSDIGNSHQVPDPDDAQCMGRLDLDPTPCSATMQSTVATNEYCGLIRNTTGIFAGCANIHGSNFYENCEYDVCSNQANMTAAKEAACGSLEAFAARCANDGFVVDWRADANCPMTCNEGKVYKRVTAACPATCENPDGPETCNLPDTESCVCPGTTVLINGTCANASLCGCPRSKKLGDQWLSSDCGVKYVCEVCKDCTRPVGKVYEYGGQQCPVNQECLTIGGIAQCRDTGPIDGGWGSWGSWSSCSSGQTLQRRTRQCDAPAPANGGAICKESSAESRPCNLICGQLISADRCKNYEDAHYLADPCDCKYYYQCSQKFSGWSLIKRSCAPCTCWDQQKLDCAQRIPNCNAAGASTSGSVVTGRTCQRDGQTKSVSSKANEYNWHISGGSRTMLCPLGAAFSLTACDCVRDASLIPSSAPQVEMCMDFNKNKVEVSSRKYVYIAGDGVGFTTRPVRGGSQVAAIFSPKSYINIPFFSNNEFKSLSVGFWIRTMAGAGPQWIIANNECPDFPTLSVQANDNSLNVMASVDLGVTSASLSTNLITPGSWYSVVIVFTGEELILYVNGSQAGTQQLNGVLRMNHCSMWLGHKQNSGTFHLDDICFYAGVLSASTVSAQYGG